MKYRRPWRNACASRQPGTRADIPQQIQNHAYGAKKYGRKLITKGVFKQMRGSIRKDTCPVVKAIQSIGDEQVSTATRILAAVIASDAAWLVVFNGAIDHIIQSNQKVRQNPRGLHQLDGYTGGLVNSLSGNLQKFGLDRVPQVKILEDLLQDDETSETPTQDYSETMNQTVLNSPELQQRSALAMR